MEIGNKIKKVRELRNYTQDYMAEKLNMSQAGYSKIERDEVDVNFEKIERISEILGITPSALVGFDEKYVFHNYSQTTNSFGINQDAGFNQARQLYEEQILLLKDKIKYLEEKIEFLQKK
jgi:transcriptional regulator with XRE-family HTH domain